ncbi:hypothetical protein NMG29_10190 [Streptomyces cocklensis]|uniref:Secreted protein n=1 Tax=Actinacidiphila cocklensis TaxID=887465 RepID=A0A9W4DNP3_9ACTN|nr:hypothetical protein [Actinacidiphila cocklensis]MDD1058583.1 hypothetical protein [Actinacidiphila cocklensis]CAG6390754.1 conserved hypothetical protein [Actinacidiphila cocklensis]
MLALLGANGGAAQAAGDPGLDLNDFVLRPVSNASSLQSTIAALKQELPSAGVNEILQNAPRTGQFTPLVCNENATAGTTPDHFNSSICFDDDDAGKNGTPEWEPQGVTGVADADQDQTWGDPSGSWDPAQHRPVMVSWYHMDADDAPDGSGAYTEIKGARISILDTATGKYAHVLLVYPFVNASGNASYMSLRTSEHLGAASLHAGGIVWYGYKLYVADTDRGFRVFDLHDIMDLKAAGADADLTDKSAIGRQSGTFYAHGYQYILPESGGWTNTACDDLTNAAGKPECDMQDGAKKCTAQDITPTTSFASLDRTGSVRHIISGEFCAKADADDAFTTGRVVRWPMETDGGVPQTDANGYWRADAAYRIPYLGSGQVSGNIQGAAVVNGKWYLSQSNGDGSGGTADLGHYLVATQPSGSTGTLAYSTSLKQAIGIEDLSVWQQTNQTLLFTVTEWKNRRMIYFISL